MLYATKTKYLELNGPRAGMTPGWLAYLANATDRPKILFPSLRRLSASSADPLSLFVACNVVPVLKALELDLVSIGIDNPRALTVGFTQSSSTLTCLKLVHLATSSIIEDVSRISSLTTVHITVGHYPETLGLSRLASMPVLTALNIVQELQPWNRTVAAKLPDTFDAKPLRSRKGKMKLLKELNVKANGTTQYLIASELLPQSLNTIKMEVIPDILNTQMLLIPLAGALYAHFNPLLQEFSACISVTTTSAKANLQELYPLRDDRRFNIKPFIDSLSKLHHLTYLTIWYIPFMALDISLQLLEVAHNLPELDYLVILPESISNLHADKLVMPTLQSLEKISKHNRELTALQMWVDVESTPPVPSERIPGHGLVTLGLLTKSEAFEALTTTEKFALAQYLDALFPEADLDGRVANPSEAEFWKFIQESLSFYRQGRAQALRGTDRRR